MDTVVAAFPDLQGRLVGKRVTAPFFTAHVAEEGFEACDYLLGVDVDMEPLPGYRFTGWERGYGDLTAVVDPSTARRLPWAPGSALILCDVVDDGAQPIEVAPRQVLRRQVERAAERGLEVRCATELEFYLFTESRQEAASKGWRDLTPHSQGIEDYQVVETGREEYLLRRMRNEAIGAEVPVEFSKGEAGRGQHEINVTYAPALETADHHTVLKLAVKEICSQAGRSVTFMAKPQMAEAGSSCHLHTSLWDVATGGPLTFDPEDPHHLSRRARAFLAGQLHAARQLSWCFAPYLNSYRRYVPGSWAPTAIVWSEDNRTCGFRVLGRGTARRFESRVPGADVNPYVALAGAIAAGLYGVDHDLQLPEPFAGNAYAAADVPRLPSSLAEALWELERSEVAAEAFGDEVAQHFVNTARQEWEAANRAVTDWELERNFERI